LLKVAVSDSLLPGLTANRHRDPGGRTGHAMPATINRGSDRSRRRPCHHVAHLDPVEAQTARCQQCLDCGNYWIELWLCLSCGWVACSNDSPNQHAKAHYEETDHPVAVPLRPSPTVRWCYVHQRAV
jgi:uncharacterized UBP type Zn finger protein